MKKFVSMIMALAMVCALSVTAFAAAPSVTNPTQDVTANYTKVDPSSVGTIWSVELSWEPTAGVYKDAGKTYTWNPTALKYELTNSTTATATPAKVKVTVKNSSNAAVKATVSYAETITGTTTTWTDDKTSATIGSAAVDTSNNAIEFTDVDTKGNLKSDSFELTVAVTDTSKLSNGSNLLGKVTVTLAAG